MSTPADKPEVVQLPVAPAIVPSARHRRAATQRVREARDRLTSTSGTRPAFDHELLRQYAQTRLSASFSATSRRLVLEKGRAFFHVAKDAGRPFLVMAQGGVVRAVGTQFDVYEHDDVVEVTLVEGRVEVTPEDGQQGLQRPMAMTAGQRLLMGEAYATPVIESANTRTAVAWLSGKLVFNDTPLPAALAQFNRYSTSKIVIGDAAVGQLHVSGVFRDDDSRSFVDALRGSYGISIRRDSAGDLTLLSEKAVQPRISSE